MSNQLNLKLGKQVFELDTTSLNKRNKYYKLLALCYIFLKYSNYLITFGFIGLFLLSSFFSFFGVHYSLNTSVWIFLYVILMAGINILKAIINWKMSIEIFEFDIQIMLFVSIITLISLIPFVTNSLNIGNLQNDGILINSKLNILTFSSFSFIIALFFCYFLVTILRRFKSIYKIFLIFVPMLALATIVEPGNFEKSTLLLVVLVGINLLFSAKYFLKKPIREYYVSIVYVFSILSVLVIPFSYVLSDRDIITSVFILLPIFIVTFFITKSDFIKFNLFLLLTIFLKELILGYSSLSIVTSLIIALILMIILITVIYRKKINKLLGSIQKSKLQINKFNLTYILLTSITIVLSVLFLFIILVTEGISIKYIFVPITSDFKVLIDTNSFTNWIIGLNPHLASTAIGSLMFNYGILGTTLFFSLIIYILSKLIRTIKSDKSTAYIGVGLTFSIFFAISYSLLDTFDSTSFYSFWIIISLISIYINKIAKTNNYTDEIKIEVMKENHKIALILFEIFRILLVLLVLYGVIILIKSFLSAI